jgi:hypothetical protein
VHTDALHTTEEHRDSVVVTIGIKVGNATSDAALMSGTDFTALPMTASPIEVIVEMATDQLGRAADGLAISYPAWWDSLRVDRLLRDLRATDMTVDRYLTSAEAAVRWWRHAHVDTDNQLAGPFLVHEVGHGSSGLTLVNSDGPRTETISSCEVSSAGPNELADVAREITRAARLAVADLIAILVVGTGDPNSPAEPGWPVWCGDDGEHAAAFGTALAAIGRDT